MYLWAITQRTNQNDEEKTDVEIEEDFDNGLAGSLTEEVEGTLSARFRSRGDELHSDMRHTTFGLNP